MSPASRSKSKDKKAGKEPQQKSASKPSVHTTSSSGVPVSGYNPLLGKFHTLEPAPISSPPSLHINGRFRNIDDTEDHSGNNSLGTGTEYDTISNNGSWSGESEEPKEKTSHNPPRQEAIIPGADNDKREKTRQKNEKKHQRQKEKRAQELHERCSGFLMSRKLEALAQQLVSMGFSSERATMALILNEGKIEESVSWLFEVGEGDNHQKNNLDEGNLKIDISEELARIADMEIRYKCSKQEVERAVVACEGDLDKAAESLRMPKQEIPSSGPPKTEEHLDPLTVNNGAISIPGNQNLLRAQQKPYPSPSPSIQQRRDEKDINYAKPTVGVGVPVEFGGKNIQALRKEYKAQPKLDGAKAMQIPVIAADKRWPSGVPNPSLSYSSASPLQASPALAKTETRYVALGSELKNLQLGSVKEPVVVMQRPQSANLKQTTPTTTSVSSSSPPGTTSGWYPNAVEVSIPNGLTAHISSNNLGSNQLYNQLHYHQPPNQYLSDGGTVETVGASRGNGLWNRMGTSPTLAAASSLGLFSGLGSNGSSGSGSSFPVDWNTGGSTRQFDYTNIDWSLDRNSSMSRSTGSWQQGTTTTTPMQNNIHTYDPYSSMPNGRTSTRPALINGSGRSGGGGSSGGGGMIAGMQDGVTSGEMSGAGGGSREWSSPFEERDIFSLPRQFVSSPSL